MSRCMHTRCKMRLVCKIMCPCTVRSTPYYIHLYWPFSSKKILYEGINLLYNKCGRIGHPVTNCAYSTSPNINSNPIVNLPYPNPLTSIPQLLLKTCPPLPCLQSLTPWTLQI